MGEKLHWIVGSYHKLHYKTINQYEMFTVYPFNIGLKEEKNIWKFPKTLKQSKNKTKIYLEKKLYVDILFYVIALSSLRLNSPMKLLKSALW